MPAALNFVMKTSVCANPPPPIQRIASSAGLAEAAIALAVMPYCTAAFTPTYSTATVNMPKISAMGRFRCGSLISPETSVTRFQPSYAHSAAISAMVNPAKPPFAPANVVL